MSPDEKKLNMRIAGFYLAVLILLTGCSDAGKKSDRTHYSNLYAKGFNINKQGDVTKLTVFNPW